MALIKDVGFVTLKMIISALCVKVAIIRTKKESVLKLLLIL